MTAFHAWKCLTQSGVTHTWDGRVVITSVLQGNAAFDLACHLQAYLIIRPTKDREGMLITPEARLEALLKGPEFAHLHKQKDSMIDRISIISADMTMPGLGMSEEETLRLKMCVFG